MNTFCSGDPKESRREFILDNNDDEVSDGDGDGDAAGSEIFGSPLCGMFQDSKNSKTDACALFCCGIYLWQRNRDLFVSGIGQEEQSMIANSTLLESSATATTIPSMITKRPLETGFVILLLVTVVVWSIDVDNRFTVILSVSTAIMIACIVWKIFEFQRSRRIFRRKLAIAEYRRRRRCNDVSQNDAELALFLHQHQQEIYGNGAHALICGCARNDSGFMCNNRTSRSESAVYTDDDDDDDDDDDKTRVEEDFCLGAWQFLASLCCGRICGCHLQLFGMCAIAQEQRYLKEVLASSSTRPGLWQRDYITMQPWMDYYPSILRLRMFNQINFLSHLKAMSKLSHRILLVAVIFLLLITLMVFLPIRFPRWQILILYGAILQPVVFLFFVHWLWNRFDLSLDAVVKYFACGFFICTGTCIAYELVASKIALQLIALVNLLGTEALLLFRLHSMSAQENVPSGFSQKYYSAVENPIGYQITIALISAITNAFFVAGLVEEFCKYLCFWMVEHPDLEKKVILPSSHSRETSSGSSREVAIEGTASNGCYDTETTRLYLRDQNTSSSSNHNVIFAPTAPLVSAGEAITVAMITVALGFACAENLLYVFVYTPPGLNAEISTLYVRCLFPIHPLAAAIQSIGVCRRELERNMSTGVGRIIFPSWVLHGCFDFSLMAYSAITKILARHNLVNHPSEIGGGAEMDDDDSIPYLCYVMAVPFIGMLYFLIESWKQRERLEQLDKENRMPA